MLAPALPGNETQRLRALHALQLLDTPPEERFDTLTRLASRVFDAPMCVVTLVDRQRQWFKSCLGLEVTETPREISFCGHAILQDGLFVVEDASRDERFADNPLVTGPPDIRFYAGVALADRDGHRLGTLAIIDNRPRTLGADDRVLLAELARLAELELERIRAAQQLEADAAELRRNGQRLREQEARLREADEQKDRFLATLAHELRNPLAPIRNSVHLAKRSRPDNPVVERALDIIERQSVHLTRLVDDLLEIARITQGRVVLNRRPCRVQQLCDEAMESVAGAAQAAGHTLRVERPAEAAWVDVDPTRIVQALQNLLHNAIKYTDPGGHIVLRVLSSGETVEFEVEDNGVGIAPEQFERLFEPFAQDQRTLLRRSGGLGIGLALSRRLVELHGGTLEAFSAGPQLGARFAVRLPCVPGPDEPQQPASPPAQIAPRRILVVDDHPDLLSSTQALLESNGHAVRAAASGREAIEVAVAFRPELVLLDIGLPDLDGYEVALELRRRLGGNCPPLVAVTGWGQDADRRRSADAGFARHCTKPLDPAVIEDLIAALV